MNAVNHHTIMTFNLRYGTAEDGCDHWENRRGLVIGLLEKIRPDILLLQEALRFQLDYLHSRIPGYAEIGRAREDGRSKGEYTPILYRPACFHVSGQETFWFSETPEVPGSMSWGSAHPRICTRALFRVRESNRRVDVYNLHLDNRSQSAREQSVMLLGKRIRQRCPKAPVVVAGDFNAGEDNPVIRFMTGEPVFGDQVEHTPPALIDVMSSGYPDSELDGTFHGYAGNMDGPRIDYIFVSPELSVREGEIIRYHNAGRYPSDHYPVKATVDI